LADSLIGCDFGRYILLLKDSEIPPLHVRHFCDPTLIAALKLSEFKFYLINFSNQMTAIACIDGGLISDFKSTLFDHLNWIAIANYRQNSSGNNQGWPTVIDLSS
jgi:hypothetical protein